MQTPSTVHIAVLDVGHGDCAVIYDDSRSSVLVIDCRHGPSLIRFLREERIPRISVALITHNDEDHLGGMCVVVDRVPIGCLALHPSLKDATGGPKRRLGALVKAATKLRITMPYVSTRDLDLETHLRSLAFRAELLYPSPSQYFRAGSSNSGSGIVSVEANGGAALFGGDPGRAGWDELLGSPGSGTRIRAEVFKFPHHGGSLVEADDKLETRAYTRHILERVAPRVIVISTGPRRGWDHPNADVMGALRDYASAAGHRVLCTEVTALCDPSFAEHRECNMADLPAEHRSDWADTRRGHPCAGTIRVDLRPGGQIDVRPDREHDRIRARYQNARCR